MTTDKDRAEFEAAVDRGEISCGSYFILDLTSSRYAHDRVQAAYSGWQVARSRSGAVPAVIEQIAEQWDGCLHDATGALEDIGTAIRAQAKHLLSLAGAPEPPQGDDHIAHNLEMVGTPRSGDAPRPDGHQVRKKSAPADAPWGYCSESVFTGRTLGDEYEYRPLYATAPPADARDGEDARLFRLLIELIRQGDADVRCIMLGDGTHPDYSEFLDADELRSHLREFPIDSAMGAGGGK